MASFCSCPASLVSRRFFAVGPGCAKCVFFFVALRWAPRPFGGARAKKKNTTQGLFFCSGPGERQGKEKPRWKPARGFTFPCLSPGPEQKKKTPWVVFFFFCSGPVPASNGASPSLAFRRGRSKKKKTPWVVFFFFAAAPRGRSLTHCGPGWRCLPLAGAVFFFFAAAPPGPGWCCFFAVAPPGRSLTHGGLGRFRQGPGGVFFFLLRPRRVFLDNSKKCLGYYIGSKKTRRGHSKKKHHFLTKSLEPFNIYTQARSQFRRSQTLNPKPRILQKPIPTIPAGCRSQPPTPWFLKGMGEWAIKTS